MSIHVIILFYSFYQMIVTTLTDGQDPGKSSDEQYVKVKRNYDNQVKGEPYITAEFANDQSRTSFPVGDGKYYSRDGVTEAKRKRRKSQFKSNGVQFTPKIKNSFYPSITTYILN